MSLVVVIGTPVDEFLGPSMTIFEKAVDQIAPHLRDGALVVLRSTVYPGTTAYVSQHLADRGCRVDVAFCPERIAEGKALEELHTLPQIIGADTIGPPNGPKQLFERLVRKTIRTTTKEAELAKLFTNTWRYMKFAVANQFFMIADQAGVDYTNILRAIREDYPRAADLPGPGFAAGPCLFKDAMQLAAFTSDHFPMGQAAMQVNEGLPAYIVSALERRYGGLRGKTVGILGMAFKAESDDPRASLSYKLRKLLRWAGAQRAGTDPYVDDERLVALERCLRESDILVLGAPHKRTAGCTSAARTSSTSGARWARGSSSSANPRHRGRGVHQRLPGPGAARGRSRGDRAGRLLEVRPAGQVVRLAPAVPLRRGRRQGHGLVRDLAADCDQVVAAAAMIGGISYFHEFAYDLLAENERILASTFDAAIAAHRDGHLERIVVVARRWSTSRRRSSRRPRAPSSPRRRRSRPTASRSSRPSTSPRARWSSTGCRTRSCGRSTASGIGERRALRDTDIMSGNVKLALSHVVPDLVLKVFKGQDPLHILGEGNQVRHYTYGGDLAHGIRLAMESPDGGQRGLQPLDGRVDDRPGARRVHLAQDPRPRIGRSATSPTRRSSTTSSCGCRTCARPARCWGSRRRTTLETMLDEVIPWIRAEVEAGRL